MRRTIRSEQKFREAVLYVARETEQDPRCGRTKLFKILFYADFAAYRAHRKSITGRDYCKADFGPIPDRAAETLEAMEQEGLCVWASRDYFGLSQKKLLALREADLSLFSGEEVDLLNRWVKELWPLNAKEVSDLSHQFVGWQVMDYGEVIPYNTVFVGTPTPLSEEEIAWAQEALAAYRAEQQLENAS